MNTPLESLLGFCYSAILMALERSLYQIFAAAYIRGKQLESLSADLLQKPLETLSPAQLQEIIRLGIEAGLKLHRFKRTMGLARVQKVLGILRGLAPENLLDIGSGRGVFLWPLLEAFPQLAITATDKLDYRVDDLKAVRDGGIAQLSVEQLDATQMPFEDGSFDCVSLLEVLEHIPQAQEALAEVVRVARRFVVLSVPSQPDDNPEHIHLFSAQALKAMFAQLGIHKVNVEYVLNHLIVVATKAKIRTQRS